MTPSVLRAREPPQDVYRRQGLSYLQMMENAGLAAYAELQKQFPHPGRLLVVCGKGNNGGDGLSLIHI